jgi:copper chaperone NosL
VKLPGAVIGLLVLVLSACSRGPEPIRWGMDTCARCQMVISDPRFAAALIVPGGRQLNFDGVDELARHLAAEKATGTAYVTDGSEAGALVSAETATYVASPDIRSPMGGHVISFGTAAAADAYIAQARLRAARRLTFAEALKAAVQEGAGAHR